MASTRPVPWKPKVTTSKLRPSLALLAFTLLLSSCGGDASNESGSSSTERSGIVAETASFDLAIGAPGRYIVGLYDSRDSGNIVDGNVEITFEFLGDPSGNGKGAASPSTATASFVPIAGYEQRVQAPAPHRAKVGDGLGVYQVESVSFDAAGSWQATATFTADGRKETAVDAFEVLPAHAVPVVGEVAKATTNRVAGDPEAPPTAIDSRASGGEPIPDPALHEVQISAAVASGKPTLIVVSTPTYCVSRFCGPITDTVQELQSLYSGRANFIHLEVWYSFEEQTVNLAAKEWILGPNGEGGNEPWVFLVGRDGRITERWDNVTNSALLTTALDNALVP